MSAPLQQYELAVLLTIVTGRLCCKVSEVYRVLHWLTGVDVYTHQIPRVMNEVRPWLLQRFPAFATIEVARLDAVLLEAGKGNEDAAIHLWIQELIRGNNYLPYYSVPPIPESLRKALQDPVVELIQMQPRKPCIVVEINEERPQNA